MSLLSGSVVENSKVSMVCFQRFFVSYLISLIKGIASTCRKFAQSEANMDNTSSMLTRMETSMKQLDRELTSLIESVTLLQDVTIQLHEVNKECDLLLVENSVFEEEAVESESSESIK